MRAWNETLAVNNKIMCLAWWTAQETSSCTHGKVLINGKVTAKNIALLDMDVEGIRALSTPVWVDPGWLTPLPNSPPSLRYGTFHNRSINQDGLRRPQVEEVDHCS